MNQANDHSQKPDPNEPRLTPEVLADFLPFKRRPSRKQFLRIAMHGAQLFVSDIVNRPEFTNARLAESLVVRNAMTRINRTLDKDEHVLTKAVHGLPRTRQLVWRLIRGQCFFAAQDERRVVMRARTHDLARDLDQSDRPASEVVGRRERVERLMQVCNVVLADADELDWTVLRRGILNGERSKPIADAACVSVELVRQRRRRLQQRIRRAMGG